MINLITTGAEKYHNFWLNNLHNRQWEDEYFSSRGKVVERSATFSHNVPLFSTSRIMYALSELDGFRLSDSLYKSVYIFTMHPDPKYAVDNLHLIDDDVISAARANDCLIVIDNARECASIDYDSIGKFVTDNEISGSVLFLSANMLAEEQYIEWISINGIDPVFDVMFLCDGRINASRQFVNGLTHGYKNSVNEIEMPGVRDVLTYRKFSPLVSHGQRLNKSAAIDREISYGYLENVKTLRQELTESTTYDIQYYPNLLHYRRSSDTSKSGTHIAISALDQYNAVFTFHNGCTPASSNANFVSAGFFNPMWFYQPVLPFTQVGTISLLKKQGFYVFGDNSIDTIANHEDRLLATLETVKDYCTMSKADLISKIDIDGLVHNKELIESQFHLHKLKDYINNFFSK